MPRPAHYSLSDALQALGGCPGCPHPTGGGTGILHRHSEIVVALCRNDSFGDCTAVKYSEVQMKSSTVRLQRRAYGSEEGIVTHLTPYPLSSASEMKHTNPINQFRESGGVEEQSARSLTDSLDSASATDSAVRFGMSADISREEYIPVVKRAF